METYTINVARTVSRFEGATVEVEAESATQALAEAVRRAEYGELNTNDGKELDSTPWEANLA